MSFHVCDIFSHYVVESDRADQILYLFPNGYGASVVRSAHSYGGGLGLYELALTDAEHDLIYHGDFTDVRGYLTPDEVDSLLIKIATM